MILKIDLSKPNNKNSVDRGREGGREKKNSVDKTFLHIFSMDTNPFKQIKWNSPALYIKITMGNTSRLIVNVQNI